MVGPHAASPRRPGRIGPSFIGRTLHLFRRAGASGPPPSLPWRTPRTGFLHTVCRRRDPRHSGGDAGATGAVAPMNVAPACARRVRFRAAFQEIVNAAPHAPAILDGAARISYARLDAWSNQIAGALAGRKPGSPVALLSGHGPATVAAMLGALKAGQIYCVVDPAMPAARLDHILADLQADLVLADGSPRRPGPSVWRKPHAAVLQIRFPGRGADASHLAATAPARCPGRHLLLIGHHGPAQGCPARSCGAGLSSMARHRGRARSAPATG
jgi:hypothetical protein